MFQEIPIPPYPARWQVPRAKYYLGFAKRTPYCVVIPVINEGERIQNQLKRMKQANLPSQADILIVDGGSRDGSLNLDLLDGIGIRGLLIKEDSGKLSSQLRVAYALALQEGYEGVVTIDGNDKDSVESIGLFISELSGGADYIQGSRYIPGGIARHTPLIRFIGTRFIHDPILSLSARKKLSDTTNGFRGYSRRFLLHGETQPFRDIFKTYELLPYLALRACRLGLNVAQVPVARIYPAGLPTPTKISFFRGHASILKILLETILGIYNPRPRVGN